MDDLDIYAGIEKIKPEDLIKPSDKYRKVIGEQFSDFHQYRGQRSGAILQFQGKNFDDMLKISRELFWTSMITPSADLRALDLDFALPFVRKEVMEYVARITSMNIDPKMSGDGMGIYGVNVLQSMYKKWRLKSNDKVEKFWEVLYGVVNGTQCSYIGFDGAERAQRYLTKFDSTKGLYTIEEKQMKPWNDVFKEIVPIEEIYLKKIWERNIQKQGRTIRKREMEFSDFRKEFPIAKYPDAAYVVPGSRIDADSIFYQLLGSAGLLNNNKVQVLTSIDTDTDMLIESASGIWLNRLGEDEIMPIPFAHKMQPYTWTINEAIDEKFAYGLPMPFKLKDPHKILNTSYTMMVETELRSIDRPFLTSDFEAPEIIFGDKKVIPVNDVAAYKQVEIAPTSPSFMNMQNSLQGMMSSFGQGGMSQVAPSKQPKAAREIIAVENLKQQALGNALTMYYDTIRQELELILKTMLQFYDTGKYSGEDENILRTITVPDFPMSQGGVGTMEVRIVKNPKEALALHFESVRKSIENGKTTEIIEVPYQVLNDLMGFYIDDIKLSPELSDELEKASWNDNVLQPLLSIFVPAGIADIGKVFVRMLEKNGEHPADYVATGKLPQLMAGWGNSRFSLAAPAQGAPQPAQAGNFSQSTRGTIFGSQSNGGISE